MLSDSAVPTSRGSSFHHLDAKTEKSQGACVSGTLGDGGTSQAVLENWRERGVVCSVISALR